MNLDHIGLLGSIIYFASVFGGGYLVALLLFGYVLLVEDNPWLRKTSVKAVLLLILFSLISFVLGLIPDIWEIISSLLMDLINIRHQHLFQKLTQQSAVQLQC